MLTLNDVYPVSNSRLTAFKKSPKHLMHYLTRPKDETPAMIFGSAFHCYLLQFDLFYSKYAIAPEVDRRTKDGKLQWDEFVYNNEGKIVLSRNDYDKISMMNHSIYSNPMAGEILNNLTKREEIRTWINADTNVPMKGIIDGQGFIMDLKTCADAEPTKFARDAFYMNYHRQAAIYLDSEPDSSSLSYYIIAIEKDAPYGISVHEMSHELLLLGRTQYIDMLVEYQTWVEGGMMEAGYEYWHYSGIYPLELPSFAKNI
jgi:hypothetical protein